MKAFNLSRSIFIAVLFFYIFMPVTTVHAYQAPVTVDNDLIIPLANISEKAIFYPVRIDGNLAEFFAVKAPDGTVRVVVNACQSCGPAGYTQDGEYFTCAACGQKFHITHLEKQKGGCNPIPVGEHNKQIKVDRIIFSKEFLKIVTTSRFAKERKN